MSSQMPRQPPPVTIGRIVHYGAEERTLAAIVTAVGPYDVIDLTIFDPRETPPAQTRVDVEYGVIPVTGEPTPGHWCYPRRV